MDNSVFTVNTVGLDNTVDNNILFLSYFSRLEIHTYSMSCMGIEFPEGGSITDITEVERRGEGRGVERITDYTAQTHKYNECAPECLSPL